MHPRLAFTFVALFAALTAGCSSPIAPTPSPQTPPSAPPPAADPPPTTAAVLTIERASIQEYPPTSSFPEYGYGVRFLLRETGGKAGAQVESVRVGAGRDGTPQETGCSGFMPFVPAGGTLDIYYTDEGAKSLSYCAPWISSKTPLESVRLVIGFQGSDNPKGSVEVVIPVERPVP